MRPGGAAGRSAGRVASGFAALALGALGCGARTGLVVADDAGTPDAPVCLIDADCVGADLCEVVRCDAGKCVDAGPLGCDDADPCTADACDATKGGCTHAPVTLDLDRDGHRAPLPGHAAGDTGACGDDCDDTNAGALPGGRESCDGVDNDCNGVVDDGARYEPTGADALRVSGDLSPASPGGVAWTGTSYVATYSGEVAGKSGVYTSGLTSDGAIARAEAKLTLVPSDASGGSTAWTGDRLGVAWSDRRDANYEIYFATLAPDGQKLAADVRVTRAPGFSINPSLVWTGNEFVVAWEDDRAGNFQIWGRRIALDGSLLGSETQATRLSASQDESPVLAAGAHGLGLAWTRVVAGQTSVWFASLDPLLKERASALEVTSGLQGAFPTIAWNRDAYLVAWYETDLAPRAVYGAALSEDGARVTAARALTDSPRHSRYPALLPLGDRALLVWSDDKDANQGYELYSKMLDGHLASALGPESRITRATGDSVMPYAAFGPAGDVGVLFRDDRDGGPEVYFSHLACQAGP